MRKSQQRNERYKERPNGNSRTEKYNQNNKTKPPITHWINSIAEEKNRENNQ
jgi:hypothetical protein